MMTTEREGRMPSSTLSIVAVNWNTCDYLRTFLGTLYAHAPAGRALEVIVVDNASTDGSLEMLARDYPQARVIANAENRNYTAANNQGLAAATGDILACLNTDMEVHPGALDRLCELVEARADIGLLSAFLLNTDGSPQAHSGNFASLPALAATDWHLWRFRAAIRQMRGEGPAPHPCNDPACPHSIQYYDTLLGACHVLRRDTLARLGPQDEGISIWCGDMDWCRRAANLGYRQAVLTCARITHHIGGATTKNPDYAGADNRRRIWGQYEGNIHLLRKHHRRGVVTAAKVIFGLGSIVRVLAALMIAAVLPRRRAVARRAADKYWGVLCRLPRW